MPTIPLHPRVSSSTTSLHNPLPQLLQTPSGLAILELQGTINIPSLDDQGADLHPGDAEDGSTAVITFETPIGKLIFPDYSPQAPDDTKWMKRVYLYVGRYQRMTGEVKKLVQPLALVQKQKKEASARGDEVATDENEELEVVEIIKYKLLFKSRPEPVNDS
ncbi:Ctf8 family protein [Aspergillus clavatus NRRL 1]|uniref:Sister chromatid cohesion protein Ctf8 n=1 Tax=Aspergillus clavatus (strain ATCC 1007 / CBS 513.65 / DSM 816 / NCTC 3887 / NRRL 1 / QM 1276 / 107) TaxID=344612 RepID=A1CI05_ASPCL|nr:uncharacterized protein ACLA_049820 [Aspergillus clavatus NRRL 1]EAW10510.1 conserved hypothetical protein [Aspergillus clavatus NRRL 1]